MATILEFRPAASRTVQSAAEATTAELIFFPGIRYERSSSAEDLRQAAPKRGRKRHARPHDSIELPD